MKRYLGSLVVREMQGPVKVAYISWGSQRSRCSYESNKDYKWYGAKGIKVEYSSRDFINWWLNQKLSNCKNVVCSRVDTTKNYSFDNIQLITKDQNLVINPPISRSKKVIHLSTGKKFSKIKYAAKFFKISTSTISKHCNNHTKTRVFSYGR